MFARTSLAYLLKVIAVMVGVAVVGPSVSRAQDDPPPAAGRLSFLSGNVSIQPAGTNDWGQAYPNYPIGPGDRIFTDQDSRAEIQVGRTYVRIAPDSDVTFVNFDPNDITFGIAQGAMHVHTKGLWDGQSLYVQTPSGTTTIAGPTEFRVDVVPQEQAAIFTTYYGDQYVSGAGGFGADTPQGQALELAGTNPVYPEWLQPAGYDELDRWSQGRDAQIARAQSFRYVSEEVPGASDLDGNGEWMPGTEYGNIWFPNVAPGWAPYHDGHWVDHDPWGWVWVEDEPWGYAPFHYGRWVSYRGRWGWIPGPPQVHPVWSPALVVFAGGMQFGGGGLSVWFPLGPGEPYRPWYPCSPRYVDQVNIANIQPAPRVVVQKTYVNIVNVTNVTTVNNVTNIAYVNRTIGATAMRQQDMAAGRPVAQSAVRVDPQQLARAQVLARPQIQPTHAAILARPPARPVPVPAARPMLINAKGLQVAARPRAQAVTPPVRQVPVPRPLAGRTVVAPPPNVKMTPTARQAMQNRPVAPQQPAPNHPQPVPGAGGVGQPGGTAVTTPVRPGPPNGPPQSTVPHTNVIPMRPPEQSPPSQRPNQPQRPATPQENRDVQPYTHPVQPRAAPSAPPPVQRPEGHAAPAPHPEQAPSQRPNYAPQPPQHPTPHEERPAQPPRSVPPENRPAPPAEARPHGQSEQRLGEHPAKPEDRNRKEEPRKDEKRPQ